MCVGVSGVTVRTYCVQSAVLGAEAQRRRAVLQRDRALRVAGVAVGGAAADARVKKLKGAVAGGFCVKPGG